MAVAVPAVNALAIRPPLMVETTAPGVAVAEALTLRPLIEIVSTLSDVGGRDADRQDAAEKADAGAERTRGGDDRVPAQVTVPAPGAAGAMVTVMVPAAFGSAAIEFSVKR